jgi:DNA-binding transcriptional LysR family regulator
VERREIEIFLTLAEELHFGRTAERLLVSTARVSQTISNLERRFGALLFERTSRRVTLTPVGRALRDDLKPAFAQIEAGIERATAAGREVRGVLRVGFFRAAAGRFVLAVADAFETLYPGCEVQIRENQLSDGLALLRADEIDLLFLMLPVEEPDLVTGPVVIREARMLAVSARHPFARRESVSLDDLARDKVLRAPTALPEYVQTAWVPRQTPDGRPIKRGPTFATIQEMLSLVGAGKGMYPAPAHMVRYYARPDVTYVPIVDGAPMEWAFTWRRAVETQRIRAFDQTARDIASTAVGSDPHFGLDDDVRRPPKRGRGVSLTARGRSGRLG